MSRGERGRLHRLGLPALGATLAATVVAAFVPLLAQGLTPSHTAIGLLIAGEGLVALALPAFVGAWSDRAAGRLGPRLPFLMVAVPAAGVALALVPFASTLPSLAATLAAFYVASSTAAAPYRALYGDLVPPGIRGRAIGIQGMWRETGLVLALVGGGPLLQLWRPLPWLVAAGALVLTALPLAHSLARAGPTAPAPAGERSSWTEAFRLAAHHPPIWRFAAANTCWEFAVAGLKTFVVTYLTLGLGLAPAATAPVLGLGGLAAVGAAVAVGALADEYGARRLISAASLLLGLGLLLPALTDDLPILLLAVPVFGFMGAVVFILPFALLMETLPRGRSGAGAGLFELSRGAGAVAGPIVTGAAIDAFGGHFPGSGGYAAMWPPLAVAVLLSRSFLGGGARGSGPRPSSPLAAP